MNSILCKYAIPLYVCSLHCQPLNRSLHMFAFLVPTHYVCIYLSIHLSILLPFFLSVRVCVCVCACGLKDARYSRPEFFQRPMVELNGAPPLKVPYKGCNRSLNH